MWNLSPMTANSKTAGYPKLEQLPEGRFDDHGRSGFQEYGAAEIIESIVKTA